MVANAKMCNDCQYFRDVEKMRPMTLDPDVTGHWCSNSKSPNFMAQVAADDTCQEFAGSGEKAPLAMRGAIGMTRLVKKALRGRRKGS